MKKITIIWELVLIVLFFVVGWYLIPYVEVHTDSIMAKFIIIIGDAILVSLAVWTYYNTKRWLKKQSRVIWTFLSMIIFFIVGFYLLPYTKEHTDCMESAFTIMIGSIILVLLAVWIYGNTKKLRKKQ